MSGTPQGESNRMDLTQLIRPAHASKPTWSNPACMGYMMIAMVNAGLSEDDIARAGIRLDEALKTYTVDEAAAMGKDAYNALQ